MKNIYKTILSLQIAALCCSGAFAGPTLKEKTFSGPVQSVETDDINFTTLILEVDGEGSGHSPYLGKFTYTFHFIVDLSSPLAPGVGTAKFVAANGDTISTEITASGGAADPGFNHVVELHTIIAGTGRFADASGTFTLDRMVTFPGTVNVSVGTVDGTILLPK